MDLRHPKIPADFDDLIETEFVPSCELRTADRPVRHSVAPRPSMLPRPARRHPKQAARKSKTRAPRAVAAPKRAPRPRTAFELTATELLEVYTPLVRKIAGGFQKRLPRNVLRDDLIAAGMSGLWDAILRNADKPQDAFEWYARVRIRGAILDELRSQDWLPRRARAAANAATGNGPTAVVRFDDVSEWEQQRCLATNEGNGESAAAAKSEREMLGRLIDQLPERERHIVASHYFGGVKFKDLGAELGVSEPRISQLHSRAMQRLRDLMQEAA